MGRAATPLLPMRSPELSPTRLLAALRTPRTPAPVVPLPHVAAPAWPLKFGLSDDEVAVGQDRKIGRVAGDVKADVVAVGTGAAVGRGADEAVAGRYGAGDARRAAAPRHRALAAAEEVADYDIVAVGQGGDGVARGAARQGADHVAADDADQTVGGGDHGRNGGRPNFPRHRPYLVAEIRAVHDVVAVREGRDAPAAHLIAGAGAGEAVGRRNGGVRDRGRSALPRRGPPVAVPLGAVHDVIAGGARRQGGHAEPADLIAGVADEAVTGADGPGSPAAPIAPRHGAGVVLPCGAGHDIVAVGESDHAGGSRSRDPEDRAHLIAGDAADEAVGGGNRARDAGRPAAPRHGADLAAPGRAADDVVAVGQDGDAVEADRIPTALPTRLLEAATNPRTPAAPLPHVTAPRARLQFGLSTT